MTHSRAALESEGFDKSFVVRGLFTYSSTVAGEMHAPEYGAYVEGGGAAAGDSANEDEDE